MSVQVEVTGANFGRISRILADEAPELKKAMVRQIKDSGKPLVDEIRAAALGLDSKGSKGGGRKQRFAFRTRKMTSNLNTAATEGKTYRSKRQMANIAKRTGLRASVAKATTMSVTTNGAQIKTSGGSMPPSQRVLPSRMDKGEWSHPVFGNYPVVKQTATPPGFFTKTAQAAKPKIAAEVQRAVREATAEAARRLGAAG